MSNVQIPVIDNELGPITIIIEDYKIDPGHPGVFGGPPDSWAPPDPPGLDHYDGVILDEDDAELDDDLTEVVERHYETVLNACIKHYDESNEPPDEPEPNEDREDAYF